MQRHPDPLFELVTSLQRVPIPGADPRDMSGILISGEIFRIVGVNDGISVYHVGSGVEWTVPHVEHVVPMAFQIAAFVRGAHAVVSKTPE